MILFLSIELFVQPDDSRKDFSLSLQAHLFGNFIDLANVSNKLVLFLLTQIRKLLTLAFQIFLLFFV